MRATFWDYTPADIAKLVGAKVRLTGNAGLLNDAAAQLRGVSMLINRSSDVVILEPAESPFSLPLQPLESLYRHLVRSLAVPAKSRQRCGHRLRARAAVDRARQRQWPHLLGDRARALHSGRHGRRARGNRQVGCRVTRRPRRCRGLPLCHGWQAGLEIRRRPRRGLGPGAAARRTASPPRPHAGQGREPRLCFVPDSWVSSRAARAAPWSSKPAMAPSTPRCTGLLPMPSWPAYGQAASSRSAASTCTRTAHHLRFVCSSAHPAMSSCCRRRRGGPSDIRPS